MSVAVSSGNFAKALWPGINQWWGEAYAEHPVQYTDLFDTFTSRKHREEDMGVSGFGLAQMKGEGSPIAYDTMRQGYRSDYRHVEYALGFIVTRTMVEDDLYDVVAQKQARALAMSMRQTKEVIGSNVYNRAFDTSYTGGDGVSLLNTAHPNVAGGTWSNRPAVDADLSETALEQAAIDIMQWENDRGLKIAVKPQKLIVPPALYFQANRIMKSDGRVGTANNDLNAIAATGQFPGGIVVNHYLTDSAAWFIRTDVSDGMKYFERRADEFGMDNDFDTENAKYKATMRFSFGWTDPRGLYGSPGS